MTKGYLCAQGRKKYKIRDDYEIEIISLNEIQDQENAYFNLETAF